MSDEAKGKPLRPLQRRNPILYRGFSAFESVQAIEEVRARVPLSGMIVELRIPDDAAVEVHKTLGPEHWTLVGDPDLFLSYVVGIV